MITPSSSSSGVGSFAVLSSSSPIKTDETQLHALAQQFTLFFARAVSAFLLAIPELTLPPTKLSIPADLAPDPPGVPSLGRSGAPGPGHPPLGPCCSIDLRCCCSTPAICCISLLLFSSSACCCAIMRCICVISFYMCISRCCAAHIHLISSISFFICLPLSSHSFRSYAYPLGFILLSISASAAPLWLARSSSATILSGFT